MTAQTVFVVLLTIFGAVIVDYAEACSCMPVHPQDQYCKSDFVILARVKKEIRAEQFKVYKIKIRKEFKMSEKARIALKSGRIQTALDGSMCGVDLERGKLYLISGTVLGLQAQVSLCGFNKPWKEVTNRQRKGFRLLYGKGCSCKISHYLHRPPSYDRCGSTSQCHTDYGICLRSPSGKCHWSKSLDLQRCLKGEFIPLRTTPAGGPRRDKVVEPLREPFDYSKYQHFRPRRQIET